MKKFCLMCSLSLIVSYSEAQEKIRNAATVLINDPLFRHAQFSFIVLDAKTGKEVYAVNKELGLAAASTQKVFTAIAAFDLLGPTFRFTTSFSITDDAQKTLVVAASGDPTFGSNRWAFTNETSILDKIRKGLGSAEIEPSTLTNIAFINPGYSLAQVPEGWIWQDIGNYYGAASQFFNWRENQFDILFNTGASVGDSVSVSGITPSYLKSFHFDVSELKTAARGSGDKGYVFFDVWNKNGFMVNGTLPAGAQNFSLSAAHPDPERYFVDMLSSNGFGNIRTQPLQNRTNGKPIYQHQSPALDSIMYWFLQKSINLYGEALIQRIALNQAGAASTHQGVNALLNYWESKGIDKGSLHILDGSGLSPLNRVSSKALVSALMYASQQKWFPAFYKALPLINGQHMKSGFIEGARSYAGYQHSKDGKDYVFAVIVNNYDGQSSSVTRKLWNLLDTLK